MERTSINASIVDQQVEGLVNDHSVWFPWPNDHHKQKSAAFTVLCMAVSLDLGKAEAAELLTEGGDDAGVDGIHLGEPEDGEFTVSIFQGKYKKSLTGDAVFPENGVGRAVETVQTLFDPQKDVTLNDKIKPRVEEIRSLVRDGYIPNVKMFLCNNGQKWNGKGQQKIEASSLPKDQIEWIYYNHNDLIHLQRKPQKVDDDINFKGKVVVEEFNYRRVLIGKVNVTEIAQLFDRNGDALLQRNIRRYLGLHHNRVNTAIQNTLKDDEGRNNFYFFNNGITVICKKLRHNALQESDFKVKLEEMQIINGGQTCKTIQQTLNDPDLFNRFHNTYVLVRIYELADDDQDFVKEITHATNSQNPVDLRDLKSNDDIQRDLETGMKALGFTYKRQREDSGSGSVVLTSAIVAEATLAIWRKMPHQAKFRRKEHFGKLYNKIFGNLSPAQAIMAVLIFRRVENNRKRPPINNPQDFLPYASHYLSMLVGGELLKRTGINKPENLNNINFDLAKDELEKHFDEMYDSAINKISKALDKLYGERDTSLQQLSATFRRGDLLEILKVKTFYI